MQKKGVDEVLVDVFYERRQKVRRQLIDLLYKPPYNFSLTSIDKFPESKHSILFQDKKASLKLANSNDYYPLKTKHCNKTLLQNAISSWKKCV